MCGMGGLVLIAPQNNSDGVPVTTGKKWPGVTYSCPWKPGPIQASKDIDKNTSIGY